MSEAKSTKDLKDLEILPSHIRNITVMLSSMKMFASKAYQGFLYLLQNNLNKRIKINSSTR
jgi:hypothetical protein